MVLRSQPQGSAALSPQYRKSAKIVFCPPDYVDRNNGSTITTQFSKTLVATPYGLAHKLTEANGNAIGGYLNNTSITVPASSDWTCVFTLPEINASIVLNRGIFRAASGGDTFIVIQTGSGNATPWLRSNGSTILQVGSPNIPLGHHCVRYKNNSMVEWWSNGALLYSATHAVDAASFTISLFGNQGGEGVSQIALFAFLQEYVANPDALSGNPWQLFASTRYRSYFDQRISTVDPATRTTGEFNVMRAV
jgi:hypothetical protein